MRCLRLAALGEHLQNQIEQQPFSLPLVFRQIIPPDVVASLRQIAEGENSESSSTLSCAYLVQELASHAVLMRLERLTGLSRLLPDPQLISGGCRSGVIEVPSVHPETGLTHALSLRIDISDNADAGDGVLYCVGDTEVTPRFLMHYYYSPFSPRG